MDLMELAQDRRKLLLDEIETLEWFLRVADELLSLQGSNSEEMPENHAIQLGPNLKVDKAEIQRIIVEEYRQKRQMAG